MSDRVWYFAYGSNMQPATFAGRRGITPSRVFAARAPGWRLVLDKTPLVPVGASFANLRADAAASTWGVAYEITVEDLAHVDLTEGVLIGNYARVEIDLAPIDASGPSRAFTLVSDRRSDDLQPSDRYMRLLIDGATTHGLPDEWIAMLCAVPTCVESAEAIAGRRIVDAGLAAMRRTKD
jgi:cation transport regulator ChaC